MAKKKSSLEKIIEVFATGAIVNMVLGGVGAVIIQMLLQLPPTIKTAMWWLGSILLTVFIGYGIQMYYERKKFNMSVLVGGIGLGVFLLVITSSLATMFFPWADVGLALQGPGSTSGVDPMLGLLLPAMTAAGICVITVLALVLGRK